MADDDLKGLPRADRLFGNCSTACRKSARSVRLVTSGSAAASTTATVLRCGLPKLGSHSVQPHNGISVSLVDSLVCRVVVDRVRNQQHRTVGMVKDRKVGREHETKFGHAQFVWRHRGEPLPVSNGVIPDEADQASGERR